MALPPTIPTSFVPRPASVRRYRTDFTNAFGIVMYVILGIVFLMALGVFVYGQILSTEQKSKDDDLAKAGANIDRATIRDFVQLSNRLKQSGTLISKHVAFSSFFNLLQTLLPTNVRFSTVHLSFDSRGVPRVDGSGTAKNFNALATASEALASDSRIKDAIFSKLNVNKDNTVSFGFSATLDAKLVAFTPSTYTDTSASDATTATSTP
jgi:hypothetical protein